MKRFIGLVKSTKNQNTAVVEVERLWQHPVYKKRVKRSKRYHCHDQLGVKDGDRVEFQESKPVSKLKRWQVIKKL